jgi:ribose-phosphate pyrophosphokinase
MVIAAPDAGGMAMARSYGKRLNCPLALVDKRRPRPNVAEIVDVIGDVDGKDVIIRDDMIDTGGSITGAAAALLDRGANTIYAACTHAILSGQAMDRLGESELTKLIVANTIHLSEQKQQHPKLEVLSVASLLGEAIHRIHESKSVSALFDPTDQT